MKTHLIKRNTNVQNIRSKLNIREKKLTLNVTFAFPHNQSLDILTPHSLIPELKIKKWIECLNISTTTLYKL